MGVLALRFTIFGVAPSNNQMKLTSAEASAASPRAGCAHRSSASRWPFVRASSGGSDRRRSPLILVFYGPPARRG